ncbi:MAG TPA: OB-fold domain-containing protein [Acidimicrobiia bacterium]|nr:OB-fold domain-containing protein [Acidimicrobiia bacterium]
MPSPDARGLHQPPETLTWLAPPAGPWRGPIPVADIDSAPFWDGLRRHELLILRCRECRTFVHPPQASCPRCLSLDPAPEPVSGRGTVYSFTVANREFAPGIVPPYVVALVDLVEQESLRLVTNLVNVSIGDVRIGMPVRVVFSDLELDGEDATLAYFEPDHGGGP